LHLKREPVIVEGPPSRRVGSLVGDLLGHVADGRLLAPNRPVEEWTWALRGGLGPLLHRAAGHTSAPPAGTWSARLHGEDLTARLRHAEVVETASRVLSTCARLEIGATLLKGISIAGEAYPEAHLRPMADIDMLVTAEAAPALEAALREEGFEFTGDRADPGCQHRTPLVWPPTRTIVELHTDLFNDRSDLRKGRLFDVRALAGRTIASSFHDRPARRLRPEWQLVYTASSWADDLTRHGVHPSFLISLFDGMHLLRVHGDRLDWDALLRDLDNAFAAASLDLFLALLQRHGLSTVPAQVSARLAACQRLVGPLQRRLTVRTLDRCLVRGLGWHLPLPLPVPGRYSLRRQVRKRILDVVG
jgi:hypothetical protein